MHVLPTISPLPLVLPSTHIPLLPCATRWQKEAPMPHQEADEQDYSSAPSTCPSPVSRQASDSTESPSPRMSKCNIAKLSSFGEISSSSATSNESCSSRHSSPLLRYASKTPAIYKVEASRGGGTTTLPLPLSFPYHCVNRDYHHRERPNIGSHECEASGKRKRANDFSLAHAEPVVLDAVEALLSLKRSAPRLNFYRRL